MGLSVNHVRDLKVNVVMHPDRNYQASPDRLTFPLHQGMGFVTGLYNGLTPRFNTNVLYRHVERVTSFSRPGFTKYRITLENGKIWLLYAVRTNAGFNQNLGGDPCILELRSNRELTATAKFRGIIQVAKLPASQYEYLYDNAAGSYVKEKKIVARTDGNTGSYGFDFTKGGVPSNSALLNFVLPHHTESLVEGQRTGLQLASTTKGMMTAVVGNRIIMMENDLPLPYGMWPLGQDRRTATYSQAQLAVIAAAVQAEINENMEGQTNLDSMYFAGKVSGSYTSNLVAYAGV
jgi:endo-1,3(4)-beta-glucanase